MNRTERDTAERALLSMMQRQPHLISACFVDLFALSKNRAIYKAFVDEYERTRPAFDSISAALAAGMSLYDFQNAMEVDARGGSYEHVVKDAWLADEIARLMRDVTHMHGLDALLATEKAVEDLRARLQLNTASNAQGFAEWLSDDATLYKTSIGPIDTHYGGFAAGEIVIIAARPGTGKTTLACTLAANFVLRGTACVLHSYEMRPPSVWAFIVSRMSMQGGAPVTISDIRRRAFDEWQKSELIRHHNELTARGLDVRNDAGVDVSALASAIETSNVPVHIIDHIGHVPADGMSDEYDVVTHVSNRLQRAAKRSGKVVIELVQLSRANSGRPGMRDLRGSGHLEQDADTIVFLHEPNRDEDRAQGRTVIDLEIIFDKAREGRTGYEIVRVNRPHAYVFTENSPTQLPAF